VGRAGLVFAQRTSIGIASEGDEVCWPVRKS